MASHSVHAVGERRSMTWPSRPRIPALVLEEFLAPEEWARLLQYTLGHAPEFNPSEVVESYQRSDIDTESRRSRVLFELGPHAEMFQARLMHFLPYVQARLGVAPFPVREIEVQLTGSNHLEYFRPHTDNGSADTQSRVLTYVYFFHREPRRFGGGALRIFDAFEHPARGEKWPEHRLVFPQQNQIVFFPSHYLHEVMTVICPSREFGDSRFTINGWYCRWT